MRKVTSARWIALLSLLGLIALISPATANEGPDPGTWQGDLRRNFEIQVNTNEVVEGQVIKDITFFTITGAVGSPAVDGWDFGDRVGYACAYVEHFTEGTQDFELHYQLVAPYPPTNGSGIPKLNDKWGFEQQSTAQCGTAPYDESGGETVTFDGSDHHPHGTDLVFYRDQNSDGRIDPTPADEFARVQYPLTCGTHYWTPGNEPGEAWLWVDVDGATETMPGLGDCSGGAGEPYASTRVSVKNASAGIAYCVTDEMDGDLCAGLSPQVTPVTLGSGISELACPDASTPVVTQTDPLRVSCP